MAAETPLPAQHDPMERALGPLASESPMRPVAAGGWRRAVLGTAVGLLAGALVAGALPRRRG